MKKIVSLLSLLSLGTTAYYAQVGINTATPQATLDILGKPSDISVLDGMIPPRLTGAQLRSKTYTTLQQGAMVYVNLADTAPAGQTVNVKAVGYYVFDGTVWQAVSPPSLNLPNGTGTIIAINGQQQVSQEISARMNADWSIPNTAALQINNITTVIIDNYNSFISTAGNNSFTVNTNGTYLVTMSFNVQAPAGVTHSGNFYYGVYNDTDNVWTSQLLESLSISNGEVTNLAFNVAMELSAGKTYSFRVIKQVPAGLIIRGQLTGFPCTFFSIKRLK